MHKIVFFLVSTFLSFSSPLYGQLSSNNPKITDSFGNENPVIDCTYLLNGKCLDLKTTFPEFNETTSYAVSAENYSPYGAFNAGTPINADADDKFFGKIPIPFNFCFFGINSKEAIIGSNGVVTFDVSQYGNINYPNIENANPSSTLPKSSIFGVYSDLVFSKADDSEIYYRVIGIAPYRKLIINFYKARIVGCNQTSTSQIVLSEATNSVEIFVENKPILCPQAKFKNSLLGIINGDRTIGNSPPGRNSGVWQAQNDAWKFTPSGAAIVPEINWFDANNVKIGTGIKVNVCPEKTEVYTVKVSYPVCGDLQLVLEDTSTVSFTTDYPLIKNYTKSLCGIAPFNINLDDYQGNLTTQNPNNLIFSFYTTAGNAQAGTNPLPKTAVLNNNTTFFVRVQNPTDPTCFRIATLNFILITKSLLTSTVTICDEQNDNVENNFLMSTLTPKLFDLPINGSIHYFLTSQDANANVNEVFNANLVNNTTFYVNYETPDCTQTIGPITVKFSPVPVVNSPITYTLTTCDFKLDRVEPFDYLGILGNQITSEAGLKLQFYGSYEEAFTGIGAELTTIKEGVYSVFVRVSRPGFCFSVATINFDITFIKIEAQNNSLYICFDGTQDIAVDLDSYAPSMLLMSPIGITTSYFLTEADAEYNLNPITNLQTVTDNGDFVTNNFFIKFSDSTGCYALKALEVNLVHPVIKQSQFSICDFKNNGAENADLSQFTGQIIGGQIATVTYFPTRTDAENNTNEITTYNVQNSSKLFAKILSFGCSNIYEFTVSLDATPIVKENITAVRNSVCDNNNDGQEPFNLVSLQSEIYSNSGSATFEFYTDYKAVTNEFSGLITTPTAFITTKTSRVFAKVSISGACFSVSTIDIQLNFLPAIILNAAVLKKCDYDFNLNETFNLNDAIPLVFVQSTNQSLLSDMVITFYKTKVGANAGIPATQVNASVTTTNSKITYWARFSSKITNCYSIAPIELQTFGPPKALNSKITDICDNNLDGLYDVNLTNFTDRMVYSPSADNSFIFFYTKADAESYSNAITNPAKFDLNPSLTRIFVRVENSAGCFDTASVDFTFGIKVILNNTVPVKIEICDAENNGEEVFDLTQVENAIYSGAATFEYFPTLLDLNAGTNSITTPKNYLYNSNPASSIIIVKVSAAGFCPEKTEIELILKKVPKFTLPDYFFCPDGDVDIQPDFSSLNIVKFEWLDPQGKVISTTRELLNVKIAGRYKINVIAANGCTFSTEFQVQVFEVPIITELRPSGNSYTVIATGSKKILYSSDGINFQESNIFNNLPFGIVYFYVKFEGSDCLGDVKKGLVLNIRNAFSPNSDGINDTWFIDDLNVFEGKTANVKIYNRYQDKIYEQESSTRLEWDGKTALRGVATGSYWYVLTLADGRVFTGWILLKNRN